MLFYLFEKNNIYLPFNHRDIAMDKASFHHPYGYDIGERIEEFKCVIKILKSLHGTDREDGSKPIPKPATAANQMPNFALNVATLALSFDDDPFEVQLDFNYELMQDEASEQKKRQRLLANKLKQLEAQGQVLTEPVLTKLYKTLEQTDATIYCQRAKQMHSSSTQIPPLFLVLMTGLRFTALSDLQLHGHDKLFKAMVQMDVESTIPEDGLHHLMYFGFKTNTWFDRLEMQLRDYPRKLAEMVNTRMVGAMIIAEPAAPLRAIRTDSLTVGGEKMVVRKGMTPIKVYHDLSVTCTELSASWGPCLEPVLSQIGLVTDLLTQASVDPSPALTWFDKMRYLRHGPATLMADKLTGYLMIDQSAHNKSECMQVEILKCEVIHTSRRFALWGEMRVSILTQSKFNNFLLCHLPLFNLDVQLDWACKGDAHGHHAAMPTAPERVRPEELATLDSFADFRSEYVNYNVKLQVVGLPDKGKPSWLFYPSTLRWLNRANNVTSQVSRPIRRGTYYKTTLPQKPTLGKHLSKVRLEANFSELQIVYFNSYDRNDGMIFSGKITRRGEGCFGVFGLV